MSYNITQPDAEDLADIIILSDTVLQYNEEATNLEVLSQIEPPKDNETWEKFARLYEAHEYAVSNSTHGAASLAGLKALDFSLGVAFEAAADKPEIQNHIINSVPDELLFVENRKL
jgi:hypothetical protein